MNTEGEEKASPRSLLFGRGAAAGHRGSERSSRGRREEPTLRSRVSTDLYGWKPAATTGSASAFLRRGSVGGGGRISACHTDTRHLHRFRWERRPGPKPQRLKMAAALRPRPQGAPLGIRSSGLHRRQGRFTACHCEQHETNQLGHGIKSRGWWVPSVRSRTLNVTLSVTEPIRAEILKCALKAQQPFLVILNGP